MAEPCAKIEELLSAYLDGRLSSEEKAQVAAHLESCPACAALLEKMHKLDEMAGSAMDDFDESVLEKLEQRIQTDIDRLPTVNVEAGPKAKKVIPVWYRYVAVAASLVLVFMIGRAFYGSGSLDEWLPSAKKKAVEMSRPPAQAAQDPTAIQTKPSAETPPPPVEKPNVDQSKSVRRVVTESRQKTDSEVASRVQEEIATAPVPTVDELLKRETGLPPENDGITPSKQPTDVDRGPVAGQRKSIDVNQSAVAPVKKEQPVSTVESGPTAGETEHTQGSVQPVSIPVEPPPATGKKDMVSTATADEAKRTNKETDAGLDAVTAIKQKAGQLEQKAVQELGKLGYNNLIAGAPAQAKQPGATLQSRYMAALAQHKPARETGKVTMVIRQERDSTAAARYVLGQAERMPESTDLQNQTTKLYLTLRAANDLYRFTGEMSYRDRAVSARETLLHFLDRFAGDSTQAKTAETYRTELQGMAID